MKVDKKTLKKVIKFLLKKLPKEEEILIQTLDKLTTIQSLFKKNREFKNFLLNPSVPVNDKLKLIEVLDNQINLNEPIKEVLIYLITENKVKVLKVIADEFKFEVEKLFSTVQGEIITAYPITDELVLNIKQTVEEKLGKKVEFTIKQDPSIIGGVIVKAGSYVLDASIKNYLQKLEQQLTQY